MTAPKDISEEAADRDAKLSGVIRGTIDKLAERDDAARQSVYHKARASVERTIAARRAAGEAVDEAASRRSIENAIRLAEEHYQAKLPPPAIPALHREAGAAGLADDIAGHLRAGDPGDGAADAAPFEGTGRLGMPVPGEADDVPSASDAVIASTSRAEAAAAAAEGGVQARSAPVRRLSAAALIGGGAVVASVIYSQEIAEFVYRDEATSSDRTPGESPEAESMTAASDGGDEAVDVLQLPASDAPTSEAVPAEPKSARLPESAPAEAPSAEPAPPAAQTELSEVFGERFVGEPTAEGTWMPPRMPVWTSEPAEEQTGAAAPEDGLNGAGETEEMAALPPLGEAIIVPAGATEGRSVEWTVTRQPPVGSAAPEASIQAEVSAAGGGIGATMVVRRNTDAAIPASHIIELIFADGTLVNGESIVSVGPASMRSSRDADGEDLIAFPFEIAPGHFVMTLSDNPDSLGRNLELLRTRDWIAFPLTLSSGVVVPLVFEKGGAGGQVIEEVFEGWQARSRS